MDDEAARRLALAGIVGPVAFALAAIIGGFVIGDEYSPVHQFVSEIAAEGSDARVLMTIGFFVLGISLLGLAWSMRRLWPAATVVVVLIALSGLGTLAAGTFSCDPGCPTEGERSTHQQLHDNSAVVTFSTWIITPFVVGWQRRRTTYGRASVVLGALALVSALWVASYLDRQPSDPVGLLQRVVLVVVGVWFVLTAVELRRRSASTASSTAQPGLA